MISDVISTITKDLNPTCVTPLAEFRAVDSLLKGLIFSLIKFGIL